MNIQIVFSTKKAHKLSADGVVFWVQKKWLRDDNTLTPAGVKSYEQAQANGGKPQPQQISRVASLLKESEKALQVELQIWRNDRNRASNFKVWLPKSQASFENGHVTLSKWIAEQKIAEIAEFLGAKVWDCSFL